MKPTLVVLLFSLLATVALAQSTPYSTDVFSATFVGSVTTQQMDTKGGTSNNSVYLANAPGVSQALGVRTINAPGIPVDRASLDVYAEDSLKGGKVQDDRQYYTLQGHIAVYTNSHYTDEAGILTRRRALTVILTQRTVIMVLQEAPDSNGDGSAATWRTLMDSLTFNKTCWLPEGCN